MSVFRYLGNTLQLMILSAVIITVYAITPDGKIVYVLSPFLMYMLISTFISGPFMLPKIRHLTHHWFLSAKAKRNYFHFRETIHQFLSVQMRSLDGCFLVLSGSITYC